MKIELDLSISSAVGGIPVVGSGDDDAICGAARRACYACVVDMDGSGESAGDGGEGGSRSVVGLFSE